MQTTYRELNLFLQAVSIWSARQPSPIPETKFYYAIRKMLKRVEQVRETGRGIVEDAQTDHCLADKDGVILKDDKGGYRFTKDGQRALNLAMRAIDAQPVDLEPYLCADLPNDLTPFERNAFDGLLIAAEPEA